MSENRTEVAIGGIVLAMAIGFVVYAGQVAGLTIGTADSYPLTASFRSAEGIGLGTDVRLAGVKIGTVTALDLNPETFRADATVTIKKGIDIPDDSAITVASEGLLGGSFIEIVPGGSPFNFEEGAEIEDTQSAISLVSLMMKFVSGGADQ
ncbi:outer membrane lipid asymmetry maintenance protein MlaD [Donghicola tyrosinivorans]|uniref:Phospholipid/cholesterol/gamma-HCH transport system substrate-binding protein n=1 Tax=Donghicola tyrosinivorans TaxID=1652492 RepID=A0A2T0WJD4_9RHOB|nr:outer membrane lipid asymmetry maintenance protein MlaD [Donghicola tyrosinivorans]PRY86806.1 phospholipid/cholesterol/gamma-HCH transport system substrate-binding protein [Donghicola tyrosinivorans]